MIDYHTIHIRPVMPPKIPNTYRDKLIARFGRIPSMAELAKLERGEPLNMRTYVSPAAPTPRLTAQKAAQAAKSAATRQAILDALTRPMESTEIAAKVKRDAHVVRRYLVLMQADGKVTGRKTKNVKVWEAAE